MKYQVSASSSNSSRMKLNKLTLKSCIRAAVAAADANISDFYRIIDMTEEEFTTWKESTDFKSVGRVLGVSQEVFDNVKANTQRNVTLGWDALRGIFGRSWIKRHDVGVFDRLFHGKVACMACHQHNARSGLLSAKSGVLNDHEKHPNHSKMMTIMRSGSRQIDVREAGMETSSILADRLQTARHLFIGRLIAGTGGKGNGAAGIPPTSIPGMFDADMLVVSKISRAVLCMFAHPSATLLLGYATSPGGHAIGHDDP
jgi:hypothetical protein